MTRRNIFILLFAGLIFSSFCLSQEPAATPAGAPATQSAEATAALEKIKSLMERPRAANRAEFRTKLVENRARILKILADMEKKHPKADALHEARLNSVMAAVQLGRLRQDPNLEKKALEIAGRIIASDAPEKFKLQADAYTILLKLRPIRKPATNPSQPAVKIDSEKVILDFAERYAKTNHAPDALLLGRSLAEMSGLDSLVTRLEDMLIKRHPKHPTAGQILRHRMASMVGKPFTAMLTKLDGTKLTLPDDLSGKVVVIDFWAIWCSPCISEIPNMKSLYAKYKTRGVEFVGISLDNDKRKLETFVRTKQMDWIHTYSGMAWRDPTVRKYGIKGIPSIWVVGRDGKVVSDNARGRLAATIEKALKAPTTKPTPTTRPAGG